MASKPLHIKATWDPAKHPRGPGGRFISSAELTIGKGGRYYGVKAGGEFPIGKSGRRGSVLGKVIVGYAPPKTKPRKKSPAKSAKSTAKPASGTRVRR